MVASGLFAAAVPLVIVKLLALNAIQGLYMPAVQACVPLLAPADKLVPANSVTSMINMFSGMAGMAVAGVLYSRYGLLPILVVSAVCFAITAVMDLLIRVPYRKRESSGGLIDIAKSDISEAAMFMAREKPILLKTGIIVFFINLLLASMVVVGIPVLITQNLGFDMDLVGINSGIMMAGGAVGGITAGILGSRLSMRKISFLLTASSLAVIPVGLVFLFYMPAFTSYIIITISTALMMCILQLAQIQFFAFIQGSVPTDLLGKVMSLLVILPFIASGLGSLLYGVLFEQFKAQPWVVVFGTITATVVIALYSHKQFRGAITETAVSQ
jgi:predicted MFS family arabinose efflux permease